MANDKIYITLRDKGTTFHDQGQRATVLGSRIGRVVKTAKVAAHLRAGELVEHSSAKAESKFIQQQKDLIAQEKSKVSPNPLYLGQLHDSIKDLVSADELSAIGASKSPAKSLEKVDGKKAKATAEDQAEFNEEDQDTDNAEGEDTDEDDTEDSSKPQGKKRKKPNS